MYKSSTVQHLIWKVSMFCIQYWATNLTFTLTIIKIMQWPSSQSQWSNKWHESVQWKKERLRWDKHGSCVPLNVCTRGSRAGNEGIENERGGVPVQSLMPAAICTVLIHPSPTSTNHSAPFLHAGPLSSMGPPHGHVKCQAHLHGSTKRAIKLTWE